jgi:hypothetical protein
VGISVLGGGAADASQPAPRTAAAVAPANTCNSACIIDGNVWQSDVAPAFVKALYGVYNNTVKTPSIVNGAVTEDKLAPAVKAKLNATGPSYLKHWGTISRNVIGNADAETATTSTDAPLGDGALHVHTATAADKAAFGNEVDFAGKNVKDLGTIGFSVYTTGENNALGNNMPAIAFEIDPNVKAVASDYSSLVYVPANGDANKWTAFNATTDTGKHWGLTGTKFSGTPCDINGSRCTWTEILNYLDDGGDDAKVSTVGVSKGRDYAGSWDVDALKFGGKTYNFEPDGVTVS